MASSAPKAEKQPLDGHSGKVQLASHHCLASLYHTSLARIVK
jgi:hypothetical protein